MTGGCGRQDVCKGPRIYLIFDLQIKFGGSNQGVQSNIANYVELGVIKPSLTLFRIDIYF